MKEIKSLKDLPERQRGKIIAAAEKYRKGVSVHLESKRQAKAHGALPRWKRGKEPFYGLTWIRHGKVNRGIPTWENVAAEILGKKS